ncbi:PREDICTED: F-box protein At3g60790-like [Camelina sativa]|uniref:F-box protein At3g60790-like n=1 Tax=Camelina sativa TaxID=90675 RepID=A0ABM0WNU1_CAMSA|nr:PREDICTED: F-box protein At3g60790-like [Camelina sativa]
MKTEPFSSSLPLASSRPPPPPVPSNARRTPSPASSKAGGKRIRNADDMDWISKLPDELLEKILSKAPFISAVRTSSVSKRWVNLWKRTPHLSVDMSFIMQRGGHVHQDSKSLSEGVTKTINNHLDRLESCRIGSCVYQCEDGTLERWIQTVTRLKHTKELTLENYIVVMGPIGGYNTLRVSPSIFSHQSLTSLSLTRYYLTEAEAFKNCCNLKTLKLCDIIADVSILNSIFEACSSLEVLVLIITSLSRPGVLKIENNNLEFLQVVCRTVMDKMEVTAPRLEILDIKYINCNGFFLSAPKIIFNRSSWVAGKYPQLSYNISSLAQEKKRIWFELMVNEYYKMKRKGYLSVRVDVTNPKELQILKEVLLMWGEEMRELEIIFKDGNARGEDQGDQSSFINGGKPFPDAKFEVATVWMYNFDRSNEVQFALASRFVKHGTVIDKLMIETSSYPPMKRLLTEGKVAQLRQLCDYGLTIECF